jgi:glycosyltransferase involved in cell wall biosynthesis
VRSGQGFQGVTAASGRGRECPSLHHAPPLGPSPLVSISLTTSNGARFLDAALDSALAQEYDPLELVVVDDSSTDETVELIRSRADRRIKLHVNDRRLGQSGNRNRALSACHGELIKFLDQDDLLRPDCIQKMVDLFKADSAVGLVFSRRWLEQDRWPDAAWAMRHAELHSHFSGLARINDGRELLAQWLASGGRENWIGEPSAVMVRRSHLGGTGGFSHNVYQLVDMNLWARLLPRALVGFVDEPLVGYRRGHQSESTINLGSHRNWLDRLWTYEDLARDPEVQRCYPELKGLLMAERRMAWRTAARLGRVRDGDEVPATAYLRYLRFRVMSMLGAKPALPPAFGTP